MTENQVSRRDVVVNLENGLHLGPSSQIVQLAQKFGCQLIVHKGSKSVDGLSMLDLLTLAAEKGTVLTLESRGERAAEAVAAIADLFDKNFMTEGSS